MLPAVVSLRNSYLRIGTERGPAQCFLSGNREGADSELPVSTLARRDPGAEAGHVGSGAAPSGGIAANKAPRSKFGGRGDGSASGTVARSSDRSKSRLRPTGDRSLDRMTTRMGRGPFSGIGGLSSCWLSSPLVVDGRRSSSGMTSTPAVPMLPNSFEPRRLRPSRNLWKCKLLAAAVRVATDCLRPGGPPNDALQGLSVPDMATSSLGSDSLNLAEWQVSDAGPQSVAPLMASLGVAKFAAPVTRVHPSGSLPPALPSRWMLSRLSKDAGSGSVPGDIGDAGRKQLFRGMNTLRAKPAQSTPLVWMGEILGRGRALVCLDSAMVEEAGRRRRRDGQRESERGSLRTREQRLNVLRGRP